MYVWPGAEHKIWPFVFSFGQYLQELGCHWLLELVSPEVSVWLSLGNPSDIMDIYLFPVLRDLPSRSQFFCTTVFKLWKPGLYVVTRMFGEESSSLVGLGVNSEALSLR